jgi:hypothetical protein
MWLETFEIILSVKMTLENLVQICIVSGNFKLEVNIKKQNIRMSYLILAEQSCWQAGQ